MSIFDSPGSVDPVVTKDTQAIDKGEHINGVDVELYRFLDVNPLEVGDTEQLRTIARWAEDGSKSTAEAILKIRRLETKLGSNPLENRVTRLYNSIRIQNSMKSVSEKMKGEVKAVKDKTTETVARLKESQSSKIAELTSKLKEAKASLAEATRQARLNANQSTRSIKAKYERELQELETMAKAYK